MRALGACLVIVLAAGVSRANVPFRCPAPPHAATPAPHPPAPLAEVLEAAHAIEFASHSPPPETVWRRIADALREVAKIAPTTLSTRQRLIVQNAALELALRTRSASQPTPRDVQRRLGSALAPEDRRNGWPGSPRLILSTDGDLAELLGSGRLAAELAPLVQEWLGGIPAGRLGEVSDLQGGIVYLASSVSDYMTGHNLVIEGGQTLW